MQAPVLCVGEVLWDAMPTGLFLGGAPYNVAYHLRRLGQPADLVSRVGDDVLGREALRRVGMAGVGADLVQVDPVLPTGFVEVTMDEGGIPSYEIVQPAAWDALALDDVLRRRAAEAQAVVFGSLAQRHATSRRTVQALAATRAFTIFDANLRPPFVRRTVVRDSLEAADGVKLNEEELAQMRRWFGLPEALPTAAEALAERFGCRLVCVTRGRAGAALWHGGCWSEHPGYDVGASDTVGAGDAFLAALLAGLLQEQDDDEVLDAAVRLGAFVATRPGATPDYQADELGNLAVRPRRA